MKNFFSASRIGWVASLISIGAGIYLLGSESASSEATVFDALMHGIGAYLVARGLWMISTMKSYMKAEDLSYVAMPPSADIPAPGTSTSTTPQS